MRRVISNQETSAISSTWSPKWYVAGSTRVFIHGSSGMCTGHDVSCMLQCFNYIIAYIYRVMHLFSVILRQKLPVPRHVFHELWAYRAWQLELYSSTWIPGEYNNSMYSTTYNAFHITGVYKIQEYQRTSRETKVRVRRKEPNLGGRNDCRQQCFWGVWPYAG